MKLKPYPKYKPSGVKWIGDIPDHWEVKKLKYLLKTKVTDGPHETPRFLDDGIPFLSVDSIQDGELIFENCRYVSEETHKEYKKKCKPERDDILMGKAASVGKIARVKVTFEFSLWSPLALLKPDNKEIDSEYLEYSLKSKSLQDQIILFSNMNTQYNLAMDDIPFLLIATPPVSEQIQISSFLDKETLYINSLIKKYQKLIELLSGKRTSLISQVVTKGLNPEVKMEESGIEWIGKIPEHWGVKRLKRIFNIYNGSTPKSTDPVNWGGDIVWITPDDLGSLNGKYIESSARNITEVGYKSCGTTLVPKSSIIISTRAPIGHLSIANTNLCTNQGCRSLVPKGRTNSLYFYYLLIRAKSKLNSEGQGATFMELSKEKLGMIFLCNPSLDEQKQISDYLNSETSKIDALIEKINEQVKLLKEHKTSLISQVVTGKVGVRGEVV